MWYVRSLLFILMGVLISCNEVKMQSSQKSASVNLQSAQFSQTEFDEVAGGISLKSQGATVTDSSTQFNVFPNTIPYDSAREGLTLKHWAFLDYLPNVYT